MAASPTPGPGTAGPSPDDLATLARVAGELADGVEAALPGWVERSVDALMTAWAGSTPDEVRRQAAEAGARARIEIGGAVRDLLERDIDDQPTGPLSVLRGAAWYPTQVLRAAGVPPVERDELAERMFPDDVYDLAPATFADLDPTLHEPGIVWGAAKAHVHLARRRAEGRR